jgi:hypothetical protein
VTTAWTNKLVGEKCGRKKGKEGTKEMKRKAADER